MNREAKQFIYNEIVPELEQLGVSLHLDLENNVVYHNGIGCSGFFNDIKKELHCAVGTKKVEDWFGTFLHEYSHFCQWKEQHKSWTDSQKYFTDAGLNSDDALDEFILGKLDLTDEQVESIAYLEYDCEVRTAKLVDLFPKIFDKEIYIQKSNAYIAFYRTMKDKRKWYNAERAPYLNKKIWSKMPKEFVPFADYYSDFKFDHIDWSQCL